MIYLAAGLQFPGERAADSFFWLGAVLQLLASALSTWAVLVNTHLESTARIQSDREQKVCTDGPYQYIRHPSYTEILIWCVATPMMLWGWSVVMIAALAALIMIIRTKLEDEMLQNELSGYREYAASVRWKLIPFVW